MEINRTRLSRELRKNLTEAEKFLWRHLRSKQLSGLKFRRQEPIGRYIVDFVCYEQNIIIEVDGGQHDNKTTDPGRDGWLKNEGFRVLRFWNTEVLTNINGVLEEIRKHITLP